MHVVELDRMVRSIVVAAGLLAVSSWNQPLLGQTAAKTAGRAGPRGAIAYPETQRGDVLDDYHGRQVADPYRWLEDTESAATADWIDRQNQVTDAYLAALPEREAIANRLRELWNYERFGVPQPRGGHYFYTRNDGLQDQSVYYRAGSLDAEPEVLIDPNRLSEDGTVALADAVPSEDGQWLAYGLADGGSDWRTWKVREVATGADLDDEIRWVKFSGIAWTPDSKGFFYGRYDPPPPGAELTGTNENQQIYYHRIGEDQSQDTQVFARPDEPKWGFSPTVTDDGRYLILQNWKGTEPKEQIFIADLRADEIAVVPLITGFDAEYIPVGSDRDTLFFITDHQAPRRRLIAVDVNHPQRDQWREVIAETDDVLQSANLFGDTFYAIWLQDARGKVTRHRIDGTSLGELDLPGIGSVGGLSGRRGDQETFLTFTNYVTPTSIYRLEVDSGELTLWRQPELQLDTTRFVTEQRFCRSKDGTPIPIIVTRQRDAALDGSHRTLLYGYGGFNISLTPAFSPAVAAWIDLGGIYAVPNLRGGGEYGRQWHEAGMRLNKQNVFDDFIAAAEYLIEQKYTSPERLAIRGRSNGGLLVGAAMTQRPELFAACLPGVGVLDMLRYQKFTIGWAWVSEYGSSDEIDQIDNLLSYSPLHNLRAGRCYPATLITTADRDDRVVPGHSFKFAAALQAAQGCANPVLIRIETRAGHGAGTPVSKLIDEYADSWAFLIDNLR